jgi:adenylosuccinate synthase
MLDEVYGFAPFITWTDCTFGNANEMLSPVDDVQISRIGVLRTYYTRHGAGPFPTEDASLTFPEQHNGAHEFMGAFRLGNFDFDLARKAIDVCGGVDELAITHADRLPELPRRIAERLGVRLGFVSSGPRSSDVAEGADGDE